MAGALCLRAAADPPELDLFEAYAAVGGARVLLLGAAHGARSPWSPAG